jgi:hypothetical protein
MQEQTPGPEFWPFQEGRAWGLRPCQILRHLHLSLVWEYSFHFKRGEGCSYVCLMLHWEIRGR